MPPRLPLQLSSPLRPLAPPSLFAPARQSRFYAAPPQKKPPGSKKKPTRTNFTVHDLSDADQFSLVDAMRYIRAFEVGQDPVKAKYDLAVKLRTQKSGPTVKSSMRLPKPVKTDMRICVIAEGKHAEAAKKAGAAVVGKDDVFEMIRNEQIDFDKVICQDDCFQALTKAKLGRILGPRGLMPSQKFGTVVANVHTAMKELVGKSDYRERTGVIRMAVGQLAFTEKELQTNIRAFITQLKRDFGQMSFRAEKSIHEVVLSSTNSAGFSLSGEVKSASREEPKKEPAMEAA